MVIFQQCLTPYPIYYPIYPSTPWHPKHQSNANHEEMLQALGVFHCVQDQNFASFRPFRRPWQDGEGILAGSELEVSWGWQKKNDDVAV